MQKETILEYLLPIADNALILGHRLSEWCGHGPVLEQDMAMTNIALDLVGQARSLYQYAARLKGGESSEDDFAYLRDAREFRNILLAEQPNGDFAFTVARQFLFDQYAFLFYTKLKDSKDDFLSAFAVKSLKEVTYHRKWSSEWVIRLGDGTEESNKRIVKAFDQLMPLTGELFAASEIDQLAVEAGVGVDIEALLPTYAEQIRSVLEKAFVPSPTTDAYNQNIRRAKKFGTGKQGIHSEHLGHLLAEMQSVQRAYPGLTW